MALGGSVLLSSWKAYRGQIVLVSFPKPSGTGEAFSTGPGIQDAPKIALVKMTVRDGN